MYEEKFLNERHQPEANDLMSLENIKQNNEIQINNLPGHEILLSVRGYLTEKTQQYLSTDIDRLNEQRDNSIIELRNRGELPLDIAKKCESLMIGRKVNTDSLTIAQASLAHAYIMETDAQSSGVVFEKGSRLYHMINSQLGQDIIQANKSYSKIKQRRPDEMPDYGAYDGADDFDRAEDRLNKRWLNGLEERYSARKKDFDHSREVKANRYVDKYRIPDEFSMRIGRIAAQHLENMENDETFSEDNLNVMNGKDLAFASFVEDYSDSFLDEDGNFEGNNRIYGIFNNHDMDKIDEGIRLRRDISPKADSLHVAKILDVYTGGKVADIIDQLDVDFIEELISENRLTAKSAVALGLCSLDHFTAMTGKSINNNAKISFTARKVEALCRQLLNLDQDVSDSVDGNDKYEDIKEKFEKRKVAVWNQVNRGSKNLRKIDDLLQFSQELVTLIEIQDDESRTLLDNGISK